LILYFEFIQGIFMKHSRATVKKNNAEKNRKIIIKTDSYF